MAINIQGRTPKKAFVRTRETNMSIVYVLTLEINFMQ